MKIALVALSGVATGTLLQLKQTVPSYVLMQASLIKCSGSHTKGCVKVGRLVRKKRLGAREKEKEQWFSTCRVGPL